MKYFEFWVGDYVKATSDLSLAEHGAYLNLMLFYYGKESIGGPLPADFKSLYRVCAAITRQEQESVRKISERFFPVSEDGLRHNQKCDEVLAWANERIDKARENANKKWDAKRNASSIESSNASSIESSNASSIPIPQSSNPKGKERETRAQNLDQVLVLFRERGYPEAEAPKFWNYYEANGWRVGRNPMKDWKAAAAGWVSRSKDFQPIKTYSNGKPKSPSVTDSVTSITALTPDLEAIERDHRTRRSGG